MHNNIERTAEISAFLSIETYESCLEILVVRWIVFDKSDRVLFNMYIKSKFYGGRTETYLLFPRQTYCSFHCIWSIKKDVVVSEI
jgi:hypothetical protein